MPANINFLFEENNFVGCLHFFLLDGTLDGFGKLMDISIGHHQGHLSIADVGPNKQDLTFWHFELRFFPNVE